MRINEIEERLNAIKAECEKEDADINALSQEADALIEERKAILDNVEKRKNTIENIVNGVETKTIETFEEDKKMEEKRTFDRSSAEYRTAFLKKVRGMELSEIEQRAFSSASSSAGAAIPTETANEIIRKLKQYAPLLGEITLLHVAGNVTFAIEDTINDPAIHTENASITGDSDTLTSVTLGSYEITKLVQVSKTVATMSIDAFEAWLVDMISEKIAQKICKYLIDGTGSSQPTGVEKAATWGDTNSVTVAKAAALTAANVQTLIGLLPAAYDKNAKFLMSKKTLFTDFMPLQDNSKNKLVTNEGNQYFVYGYPVMIDDSVTAHEAYLGDFKKMVGNLSEAINITSAFDINTNSYKYLGCAMFDSKVGVGEAFVKLVKATA